MPDVVTEDRIKRFPERRANEMTRHDPYLHRVPLFLLIVRVVGQREFAIVIQAEHGAGRRDQEYEVMIQPFDLDCPFLK